MITWTPIAEMPERLKDGREILMKRIEGINTYGPSALAMMYDHDASMWFYRDRHRDPHGELHKVRVYHSHDAFDAYSELNPPEPAEGAA